MDPSEIFDCAPQEGMDEFAEEFLLDRQEEWNALSSALQNNELEKAQLLVHSWKGYSKPYGFEGLMNLSIQMEEHLKNRELNLCNNLLREIKSYIDSKLQSLQRANQ